ncbi:MAG: VanZ family protein [Pirellulaceae bacterium]
MPFTFQPHSFEKAVERFALVPYLQLGIQSRADWVANILLFIPIGFLWMGVFNVDRRVGTNWLWSSAVVAFGCLTLSIVLEFTQIWFPPRTVSQNDIVAETIGGVCGAVLWMVVGPTTTQWVRSYVIERRSHRQVEWLLGTYLIGLLIYSVLPLDLTISPAELYRKYRDGRIIVVPFSDMAFGLKSLYEFARDIAVFAPVGMLAATWNRPAAGPLRSFCLSLAIGILVTCLIEMSQVVVYGRYASSTDVILGGIGIAVGAWFMHYRRGRNQSCGEMHTARWFAFWVGVTFAYTVLLLVIFCLPLNVVRDSTLIHARYDQFWRVPFETLYWGSEFNAVSQLLKRCLLFAVLGTFLTKAVESVPASRRMRHILLAASLLAVAGLGFAIEMAQVLLLPYIPDITDVFLYVIGAAIGIVITRRVLHSAG